MRGVESDLSRFETRPRPPRDGKDRAGPGHPVPTTEKADAPAGRKPAGPPAPEKRGAPLRKRPVSKALRQREALPAEPAARPEPGTETASEYGERSAETEAGKGEPVCAYGVEVVELLEMEPLDQVLAWPQRSRPYHRYASAAFFIVFILGLLNATAVLLYYSPIPTPDELSGGACEIAGEVRDAGGTPIANATIVLTDSTLSTFTNSDGWYVLKGIPAGTHRVEAAAIGYGTMSVRVDMRPNLLRSVDFTLEKGGADVRLDESGPADFSRSGSSYLWATPVLLVLSVLALAAALLALRKKGPRLVLAMGAASALSFGFGAGSALAVIGVLLAAMQLREKEGPPLKKLRVGISYPRKPAGSSPRRAAPIPAAGATIKERYSVGVDELEMIRSAEAEPVADRNEAVPDGGAGVPDARALPVENATPMAPPPKARPDIEEVEVYLKERSLAAKMASAEIEPSATLGRGEVDREAAPRPRRFVRRSKKGRVLCFVCVNEIGQGSEYLRCSCGKTMHVKCLRVPRCPGCGCSFGKEG